ncbi:MAG: hypothetical protein CFE24_10015 [Flavobacterium sp. BFFFF2]|nr:MAG: hypothetical protein CFE24_10015 [Flavobacterium sp. BFFFF2]
MNKLNLKSIQIINASNRVSSVDFFRGLAILAVVLYHYHYLLPFGNIGVDLFFVISGLLIGGLLTKDFNADNKISYFKFILQRGLKIWPSYYFFIIGGSVFAFFFLVNEQPLHLIPLNDIKRYLFFYQNYTGNTPHPAFEHVWSLCVEEHFYLVLPIMFIAVKAIFPKNIQKTALYFLTIMVVLFGITAKYVSYTVFHLNTAVGTHNRIDALAWGVLLNFILIDFATFSKETSVKITSVSLSSALLIISLWVLTYFDDGFYKQVVFHSLIPFVFFLLLFGCYFVDFSRFRIIQFIAYYSYNWYLWHFVFAFYFYYAFGDSFLGLLLYLVTSFLFAVAVTIVVEEFFLEKRKFIVNLFFPSKS